VSVRVRGSGSRRDMTEKKTRSCLIVSIAIRPINTVAPIPQPVPLICNVPTGQRMSILCGNPVGCGLWVMNGERGNRTSMDGEHINNLVHSWLPPTRRRGVPSPKLRHFGRVKDLAHQLATNISEDTLASDH
jgi:hypothetical protein